VRTWLSIAVLPGVDHCNHVERRGRGDKTGPARTGDGDRHAPGRIDERDQDQGYPRTHAGSLDGIVLEQAMSLRAPSGAGIASAAVEQATGDGHLRQAVVVFPAAAGATELGIVVKNVGGVAERAFRWGVPPAR